MQKNQRIYTIPKMGNILDIKGAIGYNTVSCGVPKCNILEPNCNREKGKGKKIIMTAKKNILTSEGLKKLEDELEELIVVKRKEVAQKIKEAREQKNPGFCGPRVNIMVN